MAEQTLVLLTGWNSGIQPIEELGKALQERGQYKLKFVSYPYQHKSPQEIWQLNQLLPFLVEQIPQDSVLMGWSLGGMLAVELSNYLPELFKPKAVITLATNTRFQGSETWQMAEAIFQQFLQGTINNPQQTNKKFHLLQSKGGADSKSDLQFLKQIASAFEQEHLIVSLELLGQLKCEYLDLPSLHLLGNKDQLVPVSCAEQWQSISPASQCKVLEGNHLFFRQEQQAALDEIERFLDELEELAVG